MFKGFYNPNEAELNSAWKNENTLFVFDTNVFLNLYGYAEQTRNDFFELLTAISHNIWIPYQVGLEYQRRRLETIRDEKAIFIKINEHLDKIDKVFKCDFEQLSLKRRFPKLHENTEKLQKEIQKSITSYKKSVSYWDEKQPCVRSHDFIREKLIEITEGKVGEKPENQDWLDKIYKEGEERYKNKIPPGFKDSAKANGNDRYFYFDELKYDRQYGDLILWKQLITKSSSPEIKNVIFITDDSKEDWWYILESRGKKQIGPHANLQNEIYREANLDIFYMYNTSSFLESGKKILNVGVHESSIKDAKNQFMNSFNALTVDLRKDREKDSKLEQLFINLNDKYKNKEKEIDYSDYLDLIISKIKSTDDTKKSAQANDPEKEKNHTYVYISDYKNDGRLILAKMDKNGVIYRQDNTNTDDDE
ncbi:PIN-like domain-containing protein [Aeromonas veronii]